MQNNKKILGGTRSRDRVKGSIGLGIGIGLGGARNLDRVRADGTCVALFEKHPPPPLPKKSGKIT